MQRQSQLTLGVVIGVIVCLALCALPQLILLGVAISNEALHYLPESRFETTSQERQALREKARDIYRTLDDRDYEAFKAVWTQDGVEAPEDDARPIFALLAPAGIELGGYRVETFASSSGGGREREASAMLVIEQGDNREERVLIGVRERDNRYVLCGFPVYGD